MTVTGRDRHDPQKAILRLFFYTKLNYISIAFGRLGYIYIYIYIHNHTYMIYIYIYTYMIYIIYSDIFPIVQNSEVFFCFRCSFSRCQDNDLEHVRSLFCAQACGDPPSENA